MKNYNLIVCLVLVVQLVVAQSIEIRLEERGFNESGTDRRIAYIEQLSLLNTERIDFEADTFILSGPFYDESFQDDSVGLYLAKDAADHLNTRVELSVVAVNRDSGEVLWKTAVWNDRRINYDWSKIIVSDSRICVLTIPSGSVDGRQINALNIATLTLDGELDAVVDITDYDFDRAFATKTSDDKLVFTARGEEIGTFNLTRLFYFFEPQNIGEPLARFESNSIAELRAVFPVEDGDVRYISNDFVGDNWRSGIVSSAGGIAGEGSFFSGIRGLSDLVGVDADLNRILINERSDGGSLIATDLNGSTLWRTQLGTTTIFDLSFVLSDSVIVGTGYTNDPLVGFPEATRQFWCVIDFETGKLLDAGQVDFGDTFNVSFIPDGNSGITFINIDGNSLVLDTYGSALESQIRLSDYSSLFFELRGDDIYLKDEVILDYENNPTLSLDVVVQGAGTGGPRVFSADVDVSDSPEFGYFKQETFALIEPPVEDVRIGEFVSSYTDVQEVPSYRFFPQSDGGALYFISDGYSSAEEGNIPNTVIKLDDMGIETSRLRFPERRDARYVNTRDHGVILLDLSDGGETTRLSHFGSDGELERELMIQTTTFDMDEVLSFMITDVCFDARRESYLLSGRIDLVKESEVRTEVGVETQDIAFTEGIVFEISSAGELVDKHVVEIEDPLYALSGATTEISRIEIVDDVIFGGGHAFEEVKGGDGQTYLFKKIQLWKFRRGGDLLATKTLYAGDRGSFIGDLSKDDAGLLICGWVAPAIDPSEATLPDADQGYGIDQYPTSFLRRLNFQLNEVQSWEISYGIEFDFNFELVVGDSVFLSARDSSETSFLSHYKLEHPSVERYQIFSEFYQISNTGSLLIGFNEANSGYIDLGGNIDARINPNDYFSERLTRTWLMWRTDLLNDTSKNVVIRSQLDDAYYLDGNVLYAKASALNDDSFALDDSVGLQFVSSFGEVLFLSMSAELKYDFMVGKLSTDSGFIEDNWWYVPGLGLAELGSTPWVYVDQLGWLWHQFDSEESEPWYFSESRKDWFYFGETSGSYVYSNSFQRYFYLDTDASGQKWLFDFVANAWESWD